jgi:hypothetical protein
MWGSGTIARTVVERMLANTEQRTLVLTMLDRSLTLMVLDKMSVKVFKLQERCGAPARTHRPFHQSNSLHNYRQQ